MEIYVYILTCCSVTCLKIIHLTLQQAVCMCDNPSNPVHLTDVLGTTHYLLMVVKVVVVTTQFLQCVFAFCYLKLTIHHATLRLHQ